MKKIRICPNCNTAPLGPFVHWCPPCKELVRIAREKLRWQTRKQSDLCNWCGTGKKTTSKLCAKCLPRRREIERAQSRQLKIVVMKEYGGKCTCCGEDDIRFLSLDHINNDGWLQRKTLGAGGRFYKSLKVRGFPKEGLQILCFNCNLGKRVNHGICPHQDK